MLKVSACAEHTHAHTFLLQEFLWKCYLSKFASGRNVRAVAFPCRLQGHICSCDLIHVSEVGLFLTEKFLSTLQWLKNFLKSKWGEGTGGLGPLKTCPNCSHAFQRAQGDFLNQTNICLVGRGVEVPRLHIVPISVLRWLVKTCKPFHVVNILKLK